MRIALINLPSATPVIRRYMCSYNAPNFLFPPLEILSLAALAGKWGEVLVVDAVAEKLSREQTLERLKRFSPDLVTTIVGFEIYEHDMRIFRWLRTSLPESRFCVFGHYPTTFPHETLDFGKLDFVIRGEPEMTFEALCGVLNDNASFSDVPGLTFRDEAGAIVDTLDRPRLTAVDDLPFPDYSLVDMRHYSEVMMPRPFALIQSARGCPYTCNFCVRSYGQKLGLRSADSIVRELRQLTEKHRIRSFRFIDDTFTAIPDRTIEICGKIRENFPGIVWSCLSRTDTMDQQRAEAMRRAGCRRVYIGVESGSPRILRLYSKDYGVETVPKVVDLLHRHGMQVSAFLLVGHPEESEEDFQQTLELARSVNFDFCSVGQTIPYPGTALYDDYRDQVDFSLFPYHNQWKDPTRHDQTRRWERQVYSATYLRPSYVLKHAVRSLRHPIQTLKGVRALLGFVNGDAASDYRDDLM